MRNGHLLSIALLVARKEFPDCTRILLGGHRRTLTYDLRVLFKYKIIEGY